METMNTYKSISLAQRRMEKFDKKVTWSEKLTDIKVITPQPSVLDNLKEIVFYEEEEDNLIEDTKPITFPKFLFASKKQQNLSQNSPHIPYILPQETQVWTSSKTMEYSDTNHCDKPRTSLVDIVSTSLENIQNKNSESFHQNPQSDYVAECPNQEIITQRTFDDERRSLEASLQKILGSKVAFVN
eukprot:GFUD01006377.1.p1 GENE.GFUD01006377.1~~GFUD01006377.1.p1  ORF type:complete len:186 (+),score=43.53 GFUD01006377.1:244-801(+)